jgi:hypothetical protein
MVLAWPSGRYQSHLRLFGPWVEFGRECNGILLEARDLDAPLPASDPAMSRHVKQYLEPLLAQTQVTISEKHDAAHDTRGRHPENG